MKICLYFTLQGPVQDSPDLTNSVRGVYGHRLRKVRVDAQDDIFRVSVLHGYRYSTLLFLQ